MAAKRVVLICGDRNWSDEEMIAERLEILDPRRVVIRTGMARGADVIAWRLAKDMGFEVDECPADWDRYHRAAGPIRNREMLVKDPPPSEVWAFHDDLASSKGTANMVKIARRAGVPVTVLRHRGSREHAPH